MAPAARGTLTHTYLFNDGTANDSAVGGTANGTLNGNAKIVAGQLVLDGSANTTVDLLSSAININTYPAVTITAWATPSSAMTGFHTLLGFGQVNTAPNQTQLANYFILQTHRGDNVARAAISTGINATPFASEDFANGTELNDNLQHFYAAVLTNTAISLYEDGTLSQTSPVGTAQGGNAANNMISALSNSLARIGAGYPVDPLWQGSINQIKIYNEARTGAQIGLEFAQGTTGAAGPTLTIDRGTGAMTFTNAQPATSMVGYSITSAAGSLNQASWQSIADHSDSDSGASFDNNNKWTKLSAVGSKTDFSEFEFDGGDGGLFGTGTGATGSLALGSAGAWRKSIYEDLQVQLRLNDGSSLPVIVKYTGNGNLPYKRSDLNFDGAINVSDWNIFLANNGTTFSNMSAAESYPLGDLNGDGVNNRLDFRLFKADYTAVNGAGAFAALPGNVPEPSTLAMLIMACAAFVPARVRSGLTAMFRRQSYAPCISLLSIVAVIATLVGRADAAVVHRYSFNEGVTADASGRTIFDSVGTANGIVRGAGSSATADQLVLNGGASTTAAYVDLPNGIMSSLTDTTVEAWYTISTPLSWGRVFDFGDTDTSTTPAGNVGSPGELLGPGGGGNGQDNFFYAPCPRHQPRAAAPHDCQPGRFV